MFSEEICISLKSDASAQYALFCWCKHLNSYILSCTFQMHIRGSEVWFNTFQLCTLFIGKYRHLWCIQSNERQFEGTLFEQMG